MKINIELDTSKGDTYESVQRLVNYEDYYMALRLMAKTIKENDIDTIPVSIIEKILDEVNML